MHRGMVIAMGLCDGSGIRNRTTVQLYLQVVVVSIPQTSANRDRQDYISVATCRETVGLSIAKNWVTDLDSIVYTLIEC